MSWELFLRHYDRAGVIKNATIAPLWARYAHDLYAGPPLTWALHEDTVTALPNGFAEFDLIEVWLRNRALGVQSGDGGFVSDWVGVIRNADEQNTNGDGETLRTFRAYEGKHILTWRSVLWYAGVANRSQFTNAPAETVAKTLVTYNCTTSAVGGADPLTQRQRDGDLAAGMGLTISVAADAGGGDSLSKSFTGQQLLAALNTVTALGGGDIALAWQGGAVWQFQYADQLGADKSSGSNRVLFSLINNTMINPRLRRYEAGATVALAAGQQEGVARQVSVVTGPDYAANNDIEVFVDARNEADEAGRVDAGNEKLDSLKARTELTFDVAQTADVFYSPVDVTGRKVYRLGDLVLASYGGDYTRKISHVDVAWQPSGGGEALQFGVETVPA